MPYLGVSAVPMRAICKTLFARPGLARQRAWQADVLAIWRGAEFREERYAAVELSGVRAAREFQRLAALPLYEEMIVTGACGDYVDWIAGQRLLAILQAEGAPMKREMLVWARGDNLWKARSAILCQLHAKAETDRDFLYACIEPLARLEGILPQEGDRLGVAAICPDRPRRGAALRRRQCRSPQRPQPARSTQGDRLMPSHPSLAAEEPASPIRGAGIERGFERHRRRQLPRRGAAAGARRPGEIVRRRDRRMAGGDRRSRKKRVTLLVSEKLRERESVPDLWLLFAPVKRGRIDWLVEKATELGVARLVPVTTRRTIVERLNLARLRAHSVEAAEQCERTALPELAQPEKLDKLLAAWPAGRTLFSPTKPAASPSSPRPARPRS